MRNASPSFFLLFVPCMLLLDYAFFLVGMTLLPSAHIQTEIESVRLHLAVYKWEIIKRIFKPSLLFFSHTHKSERGIQGQCGSSMHKRNQVFQLYTTLKVMRLKSRLPQTCPQTWQKNKEVMKKMSFQLSQITRKWCYNNTHPSCNGGCKVKPLILPLGFLV